jgi:Bacterial regulatory helix-turn-helix protein, lysR family
MVFQGVWNIPQYPDGRASRLAALRAFEATVCLVRVARATIELNLTTSAISHQLRQLEESLSTHLLQRSTDVGGIRADNPGRARAREPPEAVNGFWDNGSDFMRNANTLSGRRRWPILLCGTHGLQVAGQKYLVPIDAELSTAVALAFEKIRLDVVHRSMEQATPTNTLFLDACRNNPLACNLARALGTRTAEAAGSGTLISSQPSLGTSRRLGQVATRRSRERSFTRTLRLSIEPLLSFVGQGSGYVLLGSQAPSMT